MTDAQHTIDLAVRVWLGVAPLVEVADWVDARLAKVERSDELLLALAENRNRERHEVAADLLRASGVPEGAEQTHRIIVALGAAFERGEISIEIAATFLVGALADRLLAAGLMSDAYGIADVVSLALSDQYGTLNDAVAALRALVAESASAIEQRALALALALATSSA
jgi:hypothetical protein